MKYKPIIFNTEMVRSILSGRKTQTRRYGNIYGHSPYAVGDYLYVRECWRPIPNGDFDYRADYPAGSFWDHAVKWRPSIFMPKQAARIYLEVIKVYFQGRVCDIREYEAKAEGVTPRIGGTYREAFIHLWANLYGEPTCKSTVWAIEFRALKKGEME